MPMFIANENGDWWRFEPKDVLYILDTDELPEEVAADWRDENGEIDWTDEHTIWEYGKTVPQSQLINDTRVEGLLDQINHLQAVIRELNFAKKGE
jgi:hypothetical protein